MTANIAKLTAGQKFDILLADLKTKIGVGTRLDYSKSKYMPHFVEIDTVNEKVCIVWRGYPDKEYMDKGRLSWRNIALDIKRGDCTISFL